MSQRILVVDDEEQVRDLLALYFRKNQFEVSTASSGKETVEKLQTDQPALVVLDIGLGGEDGLTLLDAIKRKRPETKVVMLTGMGFVEDLLEEAHDKGADAYVSKVLPLDELLQTVRRLLGISSQATVGV